MKNFKTKIEKDLLFRIQTTPFSTVKLTSKRVYGRFKNKIYRFCSFRKKLEINVCLKAHFLPNHYYLKKEKIEYNKAIIFSDDSKNLKLINYSKNSLFCHFDCPKKIISYKLEKASDFFDTNPNFGFQVITKNFNSIHLPVAIGSKKEQLS